MKTCNRCGECRPLSDFAKNKRRKDGVQTYCRPCQLEYQRQRYAEPEVYARRQMNREEYKRRRVGSSRKWYLKSTYGITEEQYAALYATHDGGCWICEEKKDYFLHVDHNHKCCPGTKSCGKCIRGLLCFKCNTALGNVNDDVELLQRAINYIKDFS